MKKFLSLIFATFMCLSMVLPLYAVGEDATPYYNNTATATANFSINSSGLATITFSYIGYTNYATGATITSKIEKKTLWWWSDVDNASWIDELEGSNNIVERDFQLSKTGKYRLSFEMVIRGTAGDPDVISDTIEKEY